jgi:hypothetical protein
LPFAFLVFGGIASTFREPVKLAELIGAVALGGDLRSDL